MYDDAKTQAIHIRNVNLEKWRGFKAIATLRGLTLAEAMEQAMEAWRKDKRI